MSVLVLLAVLAVAATGFAPATPVTPTAPAAPAGPGDVVAPVGGTPVEELLRRTVIDGRDDPRARAIAMQTFVAERWDVPGTSTPSPVPEAAMADAAAAELESQYNIYPRPASDLDGDGGTDVIVNGSSFPDGPEVIEARSGADGRAIWRIVNDQPVGAFGWPAGADLTGDGVEDVLVVARVETASSSKDTCVTGQMFNCSIEEHTTFVTTVAIRSGADGSEHWTVTREGEEHFDTGHSGTPLGDEAWQRVDATNSLVTPYLAGDHDGDGVDDLVLTSLGFRWDDQASGRNLVVVSESTGHSIYRYDTEAVLVSGATGTETPVRSVLDSTSAGELRPLDLDGGTLLWSAVTRPDLTYDCSYGPTGGGCEQEQAPERAEVEALDGRTLATTWQREIQPGDTPLPLHADLTGDGVAEFFLSERSHDGSQLVERGAFVDGATGVTLWSRDGRWSPDVVASMDGGPGADVVRVTSVSEGGQTFRLVERIDGATGESLRLTRHLADPQGADGVDLLADLVGDVSGDGVPDIGWRVHRLDRGDECADDDQASSCWYYRYGTASELWVEDTVTGETLVPRQDYDGFARLDAAGDLDGDGRHDLIRLEAADGPMVVRGVDGRTLQASWTASFEARTTLLAAGDHDGDGRDDLSFRAVVEADAVRTSYLGSLSGGDGTEQWRVRYG